MDWADVRYHGWGVLCLLLPVALLYLVVRTARVRRLPIAATTVITGRVAGMSWGYTTATGYLPMFLNTTVSTIVKATGLTDVVGWPVAMSTVSGGLWVALALVVASVAGRA